jgi:hypothetical protein
MMDQKPMFELLMLNLVSGVSPADQHCPLTAR